MDQFIGVYDNAYSKEYCERVIKYFDLMQSNGFTQNRTEGTRKRDQVLYGHAEQEMNLGPSHMYDEFNTIFWKTYAEQYASIFTVLQESGSHNNYAFKVQKTPIGGGYHVWHSESTARAYCHRLLTWMVYLNDVEEGGETEFLYQHVRLKPKQGTLVIWPAAFTHTHRGNPPLSNDKYIITGWTEF